MSFSVTSGRHRSWFPVLQLGLVAGYLLWIASPHGRFPATPLTVDFIAPLIVFGTTAVLSRRVRLRGETGHIARLAHAATIGALGIAVLMLGLFVIAGTFFALAGSV